MSIEDVARAIAEKEGLVLIEVTAKGARFVRMGLTYSKDQWFIVPKEDLERLAKVLCKTDANS